MYKSETGSLIFSPSDLTKYIESEFVTWMDRYNIEYPGTVQPDEDDFGAAHAHPWRNCV